MEVIKAMAESGNPNSITDAGVGAICASAAISGAFLNVKINASGLTDNTFARKLITEGNVIQEKAKALETEILQTVNSKIPVHVDSKTNS
jgi:glutamate formiminotransferase/formiminotetrahydrofolate cyclodeaminase